MKDMGHKIVSIRKIDADAYRIKVRFENGLEAEVSLSHLFEKPQGLVAEILKGQLFEQCFVESGALAWPNGFELCPDAIYQWHKKKKKKGDIQKVV